MAPFSSSSLRTRGDSFTVNLGTGRGQSVLDVVHAFEKASGRPIPYRIAPRRAGDVAQCWADPALALRLLGDGTVSADRLMLRPLHQPWRMRLPALAGGLLVLLAVS